MEVANVRRAVQTGSIFQKHSSQTTVSAVESEGKGGDVLILLVEIRGVYEYGDDVLFPISGCEMHRGGGEARTISLIIERKDGEGKGYLLIHIISTLKVIDELLSQVNKQPHSSR